MATISALLIDKYTPPDNNAIPSPIDVVYSSTIPKPAITKDTEILVKVKATCVNPSDFLFIADKHGYKVDTFPGMLSL